MLFVKKVKDCLRKQFILPHCSGSNGGRSLLCNNCTGGMILHELGFRFDTPTINTWIPDEDFLKFVSDFSFYKKQELCIETSERPYVIGKVQDVHIHFMHETDPQKVSSEWNRRFARLNEDQVYCLFIAGENTSREIVEKIVKLPLKNICVLTEKLYTEVQGNIVQMTPKRVGKSGGALDYKGCFSLHKRYDVFDFEAWLK